MEPTPPAHPSPEPAGTGVAPELVALYEQVKSGANWFYWIAGLSIINTVLAHSETKTQFVLGLAITQLIDAVVAQMAPGLKWFSLVVDVILAGALAFFGFKAGKASVWAFITGLSFFLLDCALFAWFCYMAGEVDKGLLLGGGFRAFALFSIFMGLGAARKLQNLRSGQGMPATV